MNEMDEEQQIPEGMEVPETLDEQAAPVAGKGSNKAVFAVIIVLMLAFQAVSSYFIVKTLFFSKPPAQTTVKKKTKKQPIGEIYQLPGLIVNPTGSRGTKVLLVDLGLETHNSKVMVELQAREPQIRDNLITFLSAQRVDVLTDITMRERIRKRILEIVNTRLTEGVVDNAYFIRYVFQ